MQLAPAVAQIELLTICCIHATLTHNASLWAKQPPQIAPSCGGSRPCQIHGSMGPHELAPPQMTSRLVQPFLHSTSMLPTLRQTMLCVTSDAKGRIYVTYVMQSNKDCTSSCNTLLLDIMS